MIQDDRLPLKQKFLEYFKNLPVQKLAAEFIGKHENTILNWKDEDQDFCDQINTAKAQYALDKSKRVRNPEWILERLFKDHFSSRQEHTGADGEPIEYKLNDEQLNQLIQSKIRQVGIAGALTREGSASEDKPAEVRAATPETDRSNSV